jgi:hypothetical protein
VGCTDQNPAHQNVIVSFASGGGQGTPTLTGIPLATVCTVVEDTRSLPASTVVSYDPAGADTLGVTITGTGGVQVTVTNDFSRTPVQTGDLRLVKAVLNQAGAILPASFTARVVCDDGTTADVSLPGGGGPGTPTLHPKVEAICEVEEFSVPPGWAVSYSVNGGPSSFAGRLTPPTFQITSTETVTVTISNQPALLSAPPASTTTTTPPPSTGPHASPILSFVPGPGLTGDTRSDSGLPLRAILLGTAAAAVALACALFVRVRRRRGTHT